MGLPLGSQSEGGDGGLENTGEGGQKVKDEKSEQRQKKKKCIDSRVQVAKPKYRSTL